MDAHPARFAASGPLLVGCSDRTGQGTRDMKVAFKLLRAVSDLYEFAQLAVAVPLLVAIPLLVYGVLR